VVETFQKSTSVADSLAIMAEAYKQLGQQELADASLLVLETNYPQHGYLNGEKIDLKTNIFSFKELWIFKDLGILKRFGRSGSE
jgi:outer membrane protein assembly factor BamD (BamD/ComL family)